MWKALKNAKATKSSPGRRWPAGRGEASMADRTRIISNVLGLIGAAAGGVFGHLLFWWIVRQGFYALILPGGMLGLGCGLLARHPSRARGVVCGVAGLALGLFTDWTFEKFP